MGVLLTCEENSHDHLSFHRLGSYDPWQYTNVYIIIIIFLWPAGIIIIIIIIIKQEYQNTN